MLYSGIRIESHLPSDIRRVAVGTTRPSDQSDVPAFSIALVSSRVDPKSSVAHMSVIKKRMLRANLDIAVQNV